MRAALGLVEARAWVPGDVVDYLIRLGALTQEEADDPDALGSVVARWAIMQAEEVRGAHFVSQSDWRGRII